MLKKILIVFIYFFSLQTFAANEDIYSFNSQKDSQRFLALTQEIRCVVCQNQNIADSNAPLANDLRQKIYQMVNDNQSDEDIKTFLTKRYGDFILLQPRLSKFTFLLWFFPILGLITAFLLLFRLMRSN